jgi:inosine/xanthosine triphosphatase
MKMKHVIIASRNPVKAKAVQGGFERMFPHESFVFEMLDVPSAVSDQPDSDHETMLGASNRVESARLTVPAADYWVGVEGGIHEEGEEMCAFAWIVIRSENQIGKARTGTFFLPPPVTALIRKGMELGEADDQVFGRIDSKKENGAVGILTGDVIDRAALYEQAVILALIPFMNPGLYA